MTSFSEKEIIHIFSKRLNISDLDDVARIEKNIVLKCDMLVSSTDVPGKMKPWQIARKSIVSCASDLASKGARPTAAMISLGIPAGSDLMFITGLAKGFACASKEFGIKIVGGDTNEAKELVIDCCMMGTVDGRMPARSGARPGDVVVVSGPFGLSGAGLSILLRDTKAKRAFAKRAVKSVLEPKPRQRFGTTLARFFSSSIDSSDGLAISLYELAASSRVDITVDTVPVAAGVEDFAAHNGLDARELVFYAGEEYEIVATIPAPKIKLADAAARRSRVKLLAIGRVRRGSGIVTVGKSRLDNRGYVHFGTR